MKEHSSWGAVAVGAFSTVGAAVTVCLLALAAFTQVPMLDHSFAQNLGLGLIAALIGWMIQREYSRSRRIVSRTRFADVVGARAALRQTSLVYPAFEIDPQLLNAAPSAHREYRYVKHRGVYGHRRADIPVVAAENDMRALVAVSNLLGEQGTCEIEVRMDGDYVREGLKGSFVSFGLSSNECTQHYLAGCQLVDETPLFSIVERDGDETITLFDGTTLSIKESGDFRVHPGLLVKYIPKTSDPDTCWIFVMGMGAPATPGICYWLRDNWQDLGKLIAATRATEYVAVFHTEASAETNTRLLRFMPASIGKRSMLSAIAERSHKRLLEKYVRSAT